MSALHSTQDMREAVAVGTKSSTDRIDYMRNPEALLRSPETKKLFLGIAMEYDLHFSSRDSMTLKGTSERFLHLVDYAIEHQLNLQKN